MTKSACFQRPGGGLASPTGKKPPGQSWAEGQRRLKVTQEFARNGGPSRSRKDHEWLLARRPWRTPESAKPRPRSFRHRMREAPKSYCGRPGSPLMGTRPVCRGSVLRPPRGREQEVGSPGRLHQAVPGSRDSSAPGRSAIRLGAQAGGSSCQRGPKASCLGAPPKCTVTARLPGQVSNVSRAGQCR